MESTSAIIEMPKVGSLLGRFQLERELGQGSLGAVYLAHDTLLDTKVALKVISPSLAKTEAFSRLAREVLLARRVSHPGICRIFDIHEVSHYLFISMEFIEGPTLEELIIKNGVLPTDRAARLIAYISRSLASAHQQGVLHRGLTPSNLVVRSGDRVSIMDFGQALARDMASSTGAATPEETVHYMSPEVLTGNEATQESDIYSLGAILYRCVTGARPFQGQNVVELTNAILGGNMVPPHLFNPQVGQALEKLIQKSMAVAPRDRYKTVAEFREWLTAVTGQDAGEEEDGDDPTASMGLPAGFARDGQDGEEEDLDDPDDGHTQQVLMQETTLLFSDIVGITRYFDKFGDMAGRKRIQKHNQLLFPVIQRHRGRVLKTIGDAIMAYFLVPDDGIEAAIEMQQALEKINKATSDEDARINIRIGLHTGPCIIEDQDVFGDAVNVASRVSGRADGDEILISEVTRSQLNRAKEHTEFSSETTLKGKSEEFNLFMVHWQGIELPDGPPPASLPAPPRLRPLFQAGPPTSPGVPPDASQPSASNVPSPFASPPAEGPTGTVIVGSGPGLPDMSDQPPPPPPPTGPVELIPDPVPPPEPGSERDPVLYIPDTESTTETPATVEDSFAALDAPPAVDMTALIGSRQADRAAVHRERPRRTGLTVLLVVGLLAVAGVGVAIGLNIGKADGPEQAGDPIRVDSDVPLISKDDLRADRPEPVEAGRVDAGARDPVPDPKPDPDPAPRPKKPDVTVAVERPKPPRSTLGELNRHKKAVWASMRKRGIRSGDSPKLDAELKRMKRSARKKKLAAAIGAARRAQGLIREIAIDRAFIQAKLLRFNRAFDQAGDSPAAERVGSMAGDIMTAVESGRYERANALLNQAFQTLREGR